MAAGRCWAPERSDEAVPLDRGTSRKGHGQLPHVHSSASGLEPRGDDGAGMSSDPHTLPEASPTAQAKEHLNLTYKSLVVP